MEDTQRFTGRNILWKKQLHELAENSTIIKGPLTRYILNTRTEIDNDSLKKLTYGEKDESKPHKTILLVGETGTEKSTLVNAMVNYMLGLQYDDRIWCEIIETKGNQTDSQTNKITVYDVFAKEFPLSFTIIDTPGFGNTKGIKEDFKIAEYFFDLCRSKDGVSSIDAVCLVVSSHTIRLSEKQLYIFDEVLSLFGRDVEENVVVFITHAPRKPFNAIKAIMTSNIPCAKTKKGEPVYFRFDNFHCENFDDEEILDDYQAACFLLKTNMERFLEHLQKTKHASLAISEQVVQTRKQLTTSIKNLKDQIQLIEPKKQELEQAKMALQQCKKRENEIYSEVDELFKEKVTIKSLNRPLSKEATCCTVCEENCHYPGCWWVRDLSWCTMMSEGKCTVCPGKCDYTKHVKEDKIYVTKTRKIKKINKDLKMKHETELGQKKDLVSRIEQKIQQIEMEKVRLVEECYQCVIRLHVTALKKDSMSMLKHLDFLIQKVEETGNKERVQQLKDIKQTAEK